jgi:sugar/nucleoside kinase (ribokinase family)
LSALIGLLVVYSVLRFGKAMIRLSPPDHRRLEQTTTLDVAVGGVARLGLWSAWVSRLSEIALGRMIANTSREFGVDMSHVMWAEGECAGLNLIEHGAVERMRADFVGEHRVSHARRDRQPVGIGTHDY